MLRSLQYILQKQLSGRFTSANTDREKERREQTMQEMLREAGEGETGHWEKKVGRRQVDRSSYKSGIFYWRNECI